MRNLSTPWAGGLLAALAGFVAGCHIDELLNAPGGRAPLSRSPPARLVYTTQPGEARAGEAITPAIQVTVQDSTGRPVASFDSSVTVALAANPGNATLAGTKTASVVDGVATFADLCVDKTGSGYTITATAPELSADTSHAFDVEPGAPTRLAFSVQPSRAMSDSTIRPPVQLTAFDALGNQATNFTGVVTVTLGHDASALHNAKLSGSKAVPAANGVATFADLSIDQAGSGYALRAAFGSGSPVIESAPFDITVTPSPGPAPATRLAFTTQPRTTSAGTPIAPAVQITAQDSLGNAVPSFTAGITVALGANPGGGALSGTTTVNATNGRATLSNLKIDKAGSGYTLLGMASGLTSATSAPFDITAPTPSRGDLTTTAATSGSNLDPDGYFVAVDGGTSRGIEINGSVTFTMLDAGSHSVQLGGVAANCTVSGANPRTVSVPAGGTSQTNFAVSCAAPPPPPPPSATQLSFSVQPSNTLPLVTMPAVEVTALDDQGNRVMSFTGLVTIAIGRNGGLLLPGTLSGTKTVAASNGVARFSDLRIDQPGDGYTLRATATALREAESASFTVLVP